MNRISTGRVGIEVSHAGRGKTSQAEGCSHGGVKACSGRGLTCRCLCSCYLNAFRHKGDGLETNSMR